MNMQEELEKLKESERKLNNAMFATWADSVSTLTANLADLAEVNRDQSAIIEEQRKQIAALTACLEQKGTKTFPDLRNAIKARIKADLPSKEKIKEQIKRDALGHFVKGA